jgi:hypothetical protein
MMAVIVRMEFNPNFTYMLQLHGAEPFLRSYHSRSYLRTSRHLRNSKFHYHVHKSPSLAPVLTKIIMSIIKIVPYLKSSQCAWCKSVLISSFIEVMFTQDFVSDACFILLVLSGLFTQTLGATQCILKCNKNNNFKFTFVLIWVTR